MVTKEQIFNAIKNNLTTETDFGKYFDASDFKAFEGDDVDVQGVIDFFEDDFTDAILTRASMDWADGELDKFSKDIDGIFDALNALK